MTAASESLEDVARYAEAVRRNDATASQLRRNLYRAMRDARDAGHTLAAIASVAGVSRERVHQATRPTKEKP